MFEDLAYFDDIKLYVDNRLYEWAAYYTSENDGGVGWPPISLLGLMREYGGVFSPTTGPKSPRVNENAEAMEKLVLELRAEDMLKADALRVNYFTRGNTRQKANALSQITETYISQTRYLKLLEGAHDWLYGFFKGLKKGRKYKKPLL